MVAAQVSVTLSGGPADGRIVHVTPVRGGKMPRTFLVCTPAPPRDITEPPADADYHSYVRHGGSMSRDYRYWRDLLVPGA